jgi:major type 1 subunit fimbrin (pilin)
MFDKQNVTRGMTMPLVLVLVLAHAHAHRGGWRRMVFTLLVFVCGFGSHAAFAQTAICSTPGTSTVAVLMPASITVPRDKPNNSVLTSWVTTPLSTSNFGCITSGTASAGMVFQPVSLTKSGSKVVEPHGVSVTVWNTNVPGVGIAIGVSSYSAGCGGSQPWQDLGTPNVSNATGTLCNKAGSWATGGQVEMALVKTGSVTAGTTTGGQIVQGTSATNVNGTITVGKSATGGSVLYPYSLSATKVIVAGCTTADVTVDMGSYQQSAFKGIGTAANPTKSLTIAVNACPAGLTTIQYQFNSVNAVLDPTNGVLALSSTSTATGIGLQLKDANGNPVQYNTTQYTLAAYNTTTGGSYTIPLTAAYYQTAATVTPGSANAVLTFTLIYQ